MISTILIFIGAILLIVTFDIFINLKVREQLDNIWSSENRLFNILPWISGLILPVIAWTTITAMNWISLFFINLIVVWFLGKWFSKQFLVRFASGKGPINDMKIAFKYGLIIMIIGHVIHYF